jgi:hypothetical protein
LRRTNSSSAADVTLSSCPPIDCMQRVHGMHESRRLA